MAGRRTWGGIQHTLIATTYVTSSWVKAAHLVEVDQTAKAAQAARVAGNGEKPIQVSDRLFALDLMRILAIFAKGGPAAAALALLGDLTSPQSRRRLGRAAVRAAGIHCAVTFLHGPTCMYPFMDERDYNLLRSAPSVGKAFHAHYYRKGRGLAYYQITAEVAGDF